jgi:plastocyanin
MKNLIGLFAIATFITVGACGGGGSDTTTGVTTGGTPSTPTTPTTPTAPTQTNAVAVGDDFFSPSSIQVAVGTTVTWTWANGAAQHNVTFGDGVASNTLVGGQSYSRTFSTAGTFAYVCTLHGSMTGSVLVK